MPDSKQVKVQPSEHFTLNISVKAGLHTRVLMKVCMGKTSWTKMKLESLLGHLSHAANVITQGNTFLRSLLSLSSVALMPHRNLSLNLSASYRPDMSSLSNHSHDIWCFGCFRCGGCLITTGHSSLTGMWVTLYLVGHCTWDNMACSSQILSVPWATLVMYLLCHLPFTKLLV